MVASAEVAMATPNADRWIDRMAPAPPVELLEHDAAEVLADWYEDLGFRAGRPTADAEEREPDDEDPSPPRWVSGYEFIVQPVFEDGPAAGTPWADGPGGLWR